MESNQNLMPLVVATAGTLRAHAIAARLASLEANIAMLSRSEGDLQQRITDLELFRTSAKAPNRCLEENVEAITTLLQEVAPDLVTDQPARVDSCYDTFVTFVP